MSGPAQLLESENRWESRMGGWFPGERVVFRGRDLHRDLKDLSWLELYLFGITGRRFTPVELKILNAIWVYTSFPDPRLWNNRVAALAGTARSTGALGVGAAVAVSEASIYGRRPDIRCIDFLLRAQQRQDAGETLRAIVEDELQRFRGIPGYGRPMVRGDERIPHMLDLLLENGMEQGAHVQLALAVERELAAGRWRMQMNVAMLCAAICADLGFTPREFYRYALPSFIAGMLPCTIEATEKTEGTFFPLRCARIAYEGAPRRSWDAASS
jgi:Citrate synthase, C-terminal domain